MNDDLDSSTGAGAPARDDAGYWSSDDLLADLDGANGEQARAVATGYLMAIRDADGLSAGTLLEYLSSGRGSVEELTGMGYVMAVRECMEPPGPADQRQRAPAAGSRMRRDAAHVKAWLQRHPQGVLQLAMASVQIALAKESPAGGRSPAPARRGRFDVRAWIDAQSAVAKGMAALAAAMAVVVVLQAAPLPGSHLRTAAERDLEVSQHAENIMAMLLEQRRYEKDSIINVSDPQESDAYAKKWNEARVAMARTLDSLGKFDLTEDDRQSLGEIRRDFHQYEQGYLQLLAQMQSGRIRTPEDANKLFESYKPAAHRMEANGVQIAARALRRMQVR